MKRTAIALAVTILSLLATQVLTTEPRDRGPQLPVVSPPPPALTTELAEFDFDDGFGGPDPQGWTTVDLSAQTDTFSHVDDFSGMPAPWAPNEGSQSYWIGTRGEGPEFCNWVNPPGYGNQWIEHLESVPFSTTGNVTFSYKITYDVEAGYDPLTVEYLSKTNRWNILAFYAGPGIALGQAHDVGNYVIPTDSINGSVRFRFKFLSDGCCSDEDGRYPNIDTWGAAIIDSITVEDSTGVIDYEDFEDEAFGARVTTDGDWFSGSTSYFGDHATLFDGSTVLQEDSVNTSYLWGFFDGSTDTYACGGFPGQLVVPLLPDAGYAFPNAYARNGITSPVIDLRKDKNGDPVPGPPDQISFEYDVYVDLVSNNRVYYNLSVRAFSDNGCFSGQWSQYNPGNIGPNKGWHREQLVISLGGQTTFIQYRLFAVDYGWDGLHTCNSHAPLFDNVTVEGWFDDVTGIPTAVEAAYVLHDNTPNPFNPTTTIAFDVPPGGGHVRLRIFDVSGRLVDTLVDGFRAEGTYRPTWDGRDAASGVYFYRLDAPGFTASRKMALLK